MSEPMGSEWSGLLISRLLLLNFLFLWQLGTTAAADNGNTTTVGTIAPGEVKALQRLNESFRSSFELNSTCPNEEDAQIKCSCRNSNEACSITAINFTSKYLGGVISPSAGDFENLEVLDLSNNQLSGSIPSELGKLQRLKELILSNNMLAESIPYDLTTLQSLIVLDLSSNKLTGSIPGRRHVGWLLGKAAASLGEKEDKSDTGLQNLEVIDLSNNQLSGGIPSWMGNLTRLKELILSSNELTELEMLSTSADVLKNLEVLDLSNNQLAGGIPSWLGNLTRLKKLDLSNNELTGSIPSELTNLQSLEKLDLSSNNLEGVIPQNLTGLQSLNYLVLSNNKLSGPIPDSIGDCKKLVSIYLGYNILNETIPKSLGKLSSLQTLYLDSNSLSGNIPPELGNLSALIYLSVDDNEFEGNLTEELGNLVNLEKLYLTSNKLNGSIPDTYAKLIHLEIFAVGGNYLSGQIPSYIRKWLNLTELILIGNNFEGNLPAEIFTLPNLERLWVSDVSKPGISFPQHEVKPESLTDVVLRNCNINSIPEYIGNWSDLYYLDLSFNNLSGAIPESFQNVTYKLFLTNNIFTNLPSWIAKPNGYSYPKTDLSYNNFNVSWCENITCLGLENVNIHPTRYFIADMLKETCHQKHNSLFINCGGENVTVGKHHYYNDTSTASFNLSPSEDWAYSFSGESNSVRNSTCVVSNPEAKLENNFRLAPVSLTYYGRCLRKGKYFVTLHFAQTLFSNREDNSKRVFDVYIQKELVKKDLNIKELPGEQNYEERKLRFPAEINDGLLEIHFFWAGKGSLYNLAANNGPLISAISVTRVPRKLKPWEIAVITVSCVSFLLLLLAIMWRMGWIGDRELRENKVKIGERTFTIKQIIDATKKFSPKMELGRGRSGIIYKAELPDLTVAVKKLFSQSKAVNEIASEVYAMKALDLKHENLVTLLATYSRKHLHLLIYEYMELGSLGKVLFDTSSTVQLDWPKRFAICRGIAKGLKYLHERNPQIIHRNMKTNNILLDATCHPKIADFGLAKLYEEENPYSAIGAGGELLYMSPEYATRKAMTIKVDVYSFGILLLEIVSGRNNAEYRPNQETVFLLDTAGNLHAKQKLGELVDTRLHPYDWDQVNIVLNLAIKCTDQSPSLRPTMSQVMTVLEGQKTLEDVSKDITPST